MSYSNFNTFKLFENVGINSSSDYALSMEPNGNNISFHSSNSIDYNNVDIMSIKNIINKKQNEDLNLSSLTGTTINPVITINNNNQDCRIMTNLNVSGNINLTNEGMIKTTGIGSFGSINCGVGTFTSIDSATITSTNTNNAIVRRDGLGNFSAGTMNGTAAFANQVLMTSDSTNNPRYISFANGTSSSSPLYGSNSLQYNPSTSRLTTGTINCTTGKSVFGGNVGFMNSNASYPVDVIGDINLTGELRVNGVAQSFGGSTPWVTGSGGDIYFSGSGNVGIKKSNPQHALDVEGDIMMRGGDFYSSSTLYIQSQSGAIVFWPGGNDTAQFTTDKKLKINKGGTPQANLHVGNGNLYSFSNSGGFYGADGHTYSDSSTTRGSICAIFDKVVKAEAYVAASDSRIKTNIVDVPDNLALQQLRSIPCRYYEYIDKVARGANKTIGFIAQEVKSVMPMSVSEQKQIIPNVYKNINCTWTSTNGKFNMNSPDLPNVNGVKYKFYVSNSNDFTDEKCIELTGNSDNTFIFDTQYTNVFCYGSEVNDFNILDKQKLFTLNFSATQELDRIQQTHITEIASLKIEVSTLKTENIELKSIIDKLKTANSFEEFKNSL